MSVACIAWGRVQNMSLCWTWTLLDLAAILRGRAAGGYVSCDADHGTGHSRVRTIALKS